MNRIFGLLIPALALAVPGLAQYAIITNGLPTATVNQGYSTVVQTNGSASASACSIVSGTLPSGLSVQVNGTGCLISGVPSTAVTSNFSMTVSNTQGQTTPPVSFALLVFGITTSPSSLPVGTVNTSYNFAFQANGGTQYQWSVIAGSLPLNLQLGTSGLLSGQLTVTGNYTFTLRVSDPGLGLSDTRIFTITVGASGGGQQFRIVPGTLPGANVGQSYSASIQTTGASGNLSQNGCPVQGSLPPGIVIGPVGTTCTLAGTPSNPGTYTFQVQAIDSQNRATPVESFTIVVSGSSGGGSGGIVITNSFVPNGTTAVLYRPNGANFQFTASGGTGIYSWFIDGGTLPNGLTLNTDGTLTGTPTLAGTFNFTVRVAASGLLTSYQQTGTKSFSMTITSGGLTIVETSLPSATTGQPYSFQLHANGGTAPYRWTLGSTGAQGITIDLNSGLISGTTSSTGTFTLPITVTDNGGTQSTVNFQFTAFGSFTISTASLPQGFPGSSYSGTMQASGGQTPYQWSVTSGALPPGLTLSQAGSLNGVPSTDGQYTATITATDAAGRTASKIFVIQIGPAGPVQITSAILQDGSTGVQYSQALNASGGQSPYTWSVSAGTLPPGLNLAGNVIQGTPTQGGTFAFALKATDAIGNASAKGFTITIASAGLVLSSSQLTFSYVVNGVQPAAQPVNVSSSVSKTFTATSNSSWLSVSQSSPSTPSVLTISVNPQSLGAGVYNGLVTVTSGSDPSQTISVTFTISGSSGVTVSPSTLAFTYVSAGVIPAAQNLSITSTGTNLSFAASASGGGWLQVSPQSGTIPGTLSVTVTPLSLAPGVYTGAVVIQAAGVSQQVPVTLTVTSAQTPNLTLTVPSLTYNYTVGGPLPPAQFFTVSSGPRQSFSATIASAAWLSVTPDVGSTPATLGAAVNPAGLAPGTYLANITITTTGATGNASISLPVALIISSSGAPVISAVVNSASYASGPIAPGELVTIGGSGLGPTTALGLALDSSGKVATTLGGVQVFFNSTPAPLIYVSPTQINAVVPYEVTGQLNVLVSVRYQARTSVTFPLTTTFSAPGLFTLNASGTGPGAIVNQDGTINRPSSPARKGAVVTLYLTGEGQTAPAGITGNVTTAISGPQPTPRPILPVSVFIGGQQAPLSFIGEAPGIVAGVLQVNALIPTDAASGDLPVEVTVGANKSQSGVTVSLQ